jgi:hypothetical protein
MSLHVGTKCLLCVPCRAGAARMLPPSRGDHCACDSTCVCMFCSPNCPHLAYVLNTFCLRLLLSWNVCTQTRAHAHIRTPLLDCALSLQQVLQVQHKATGVIHAMKIMKKERILQKDHSEYVRSERDVLTSVVHPYIVNLRCSFQVSLTARIAGRGFAML